jgi:hypothetical protein
MHLSVVSKSTKVCHFSMVDDLSILDSTFPDSCIQAAYIAIFHAAFIPARDLYHWEIVCAIASSWFANSQKDVRIMSCRTLCDL